MRPVTRVALTHLGNALQSTRLQPVLINGHYHDHLEHDGCSVPDAGRDPTAGSLAEKERLVAAAVCFRGGVHGGNGVVRAVADASRVGG